mmetsp:Transcript_42811/g.115053  ORF Transcript_42811/g.115053 Transcript_42811/m.115053 type:complete len:200 (-) Transcript_42811:187-786(-)
MHLMAACLVSRLFSISWLSSTRKPASETAWAACWKAAGSPIHSHGMAPLPSRPTSSPSALHRCLSATFAASLASSADISCPSPSALAPPLPRPRPRRAPTVSALSRRNSRSAAQRKKKMQTLQAVRASRAALSIFVCSFLLEPTVFSAFLARATSAPTRRAASASRSTMRGPTPSSRRGHACKSAKTSEKGSSSASAYP